MSEWKGYKLGEVAIFNMGQSPESKFYNEIGNGMPFLQGNRTFGLKFPSFDTYCAEPKKIAYKGEILFSVRAPVGDINIANTNICIGRGLCSINFKNGNNLFLFYLLHFIKKEIINAESGTVFGSVSRNDLENISVIIPVDTTEQKSIASVLSSLDDKIDLLHRQNKTLEALAETLFRQWFVRRPELIEGEEAEEGWETGTIEDEFDFTMGQSPPGLSYNEDGKGMVFFQGRTDFGFRFPEPRVYTTEPNRLAKKFDTMISVRAPVGDINMAMEECCLGRGIAAFHYKKNPSYYTYTYYKLRSLMAQIKQFEDSGTVFGSIGKDDFKKLENIIPPNKVIDKFQSEVGQLDEKIYINTLQIKILIHLSDTLLPKLMSGEVRVKDD